MFSWTGNRVVWNGRSGSGEDRHMWRMLVTHNFVAKLKNVLLQALTQERNDVRERGTCL